MDLVPRRDDLPQRYDRTPIERLVEDFLSALNEHTRRSYRSDLDRFRAWLGSESLDQAARTLLERGPGPANDLILRWKKHLVEEGYAPASVNRRLAALRSLVQLARVLGVVEWTLAIRGVKSRAYRDVRGPSREDVRKLLAAAESQKDSKRAARDSAIIRLLYERALRRGEVVGLDVEHVDLDGMKVVVLGKGRRERDVLSIAPQTRDALTRWLKQRGQENGPLFGSLRQRKGHRLTGRTVHALLRKLSRVAGVKDVRPHGLRHAAITAALDITSGDVRAVQSFSRHEKVDTVQTYDDARASAGDDVVKKLAEALEKTEQGPQ